MGVAKKWIFPILRLVLLAILAVALVKLTFFAETAEALDPRIPTGEITQPQVQVALGTIVNNVNVTGQVVADPAVPVRATGLGTVDEVFITEGKSVKKGDKIFDIRVETMPDAVANAQVPQNIAGNTEVGGETGGTGANGEADEDVVLPPPPIPVEPQPIISFAKVYAPADGILSSLTVIPGQVLAVGDVAGQVAPPTFSVTGSMTPEQLFGLIDKPGEAQIAVAHGPAPFSCTGLEISTPLAGAVVGDGVGEGSGEGGTMVRCAVPTDIRVFAGLAAEITIPGGIAEDVLTVPTTAVKGSNQNGIVWFLLPDGTTEEREVALGLNDGFMVEIADGLAEGDTVLEFVPGAVPIDPWADWEPGMPEPGMLEPDMPMGGDGEVCYEDDEGDTICEGGGG